MKSDNEFRRGLIDGIPIGLAYVVCFVLHLEFQERLREFLYGHLL